MPNIDGNETADQLGKDAPAPENEEELPSQEDRCTSLATYGGVLRMRSGGAQMNGSKRSARVKNITTSITSTSQTGQSQKPKNRRHRFFSAQGRPCPHWSTLKRDQEGRRRQVLVVHSRGSTIA
jgi:hypothetical protein